MLEIEKGISFKSPGQGIKKYPWDEMDVGDSFFIPEAGKSHNFNSQCLTASKTYGKVFKARRVEGGMRVWRVE